MAVFDERKLDPRLEELRTRLGLAMSLSTSPVETHAGHVRLKKRGPALALSLTKVYSLPSAGYLRWIL